MSAPSLTRGRILVADDDAAMRQVVKQLFLQDGFEVHEAEGGLDLLRIMQAVPTDLPQIVITDLEMPRGSGIFALIHIRRAFPTVPIILITSFGSAELRREALRLGAVAMVDKPCSLVALRLLVNQVASGLTVSS